MVQLRNGSEVEEGNLRSAYMSLELLWSTEPLAASELARSARDPQHVTRKETGDRLVTLRLADRRNDDGTLVIHEETRNIILSTYAGDGLGLDMVNPIAS